MALPEGVLNQQGNGKPLCIAHYSARVLKMCASHIHCLFLAKCCEHCNAELAPSTALGPIKGWKQSQGINYA